MLLDFGLTAQKCFKKWLLQWRSCGAFISSLSVTATHIFIHPHFHILALQANNRGLLNCRCWEGLQGIRYLYYEAEPEMIWDIHICIRISRNNKSISLMFFNCISHHWPIVERIKDFWGFPLNPGSWSFESCCALWLLWIWLILAYSAG